MDEKRVEDILKSKLSPEAWADEVIDILRDERSSQATRLKAAEMFAKYAYGTPEKKEPAPKKLTQNNFHFSMENMTPEFIESKTKDVMDFSLPEKTETDGVQEE